MNHLADSTSPYLRQHAANPVDWYPWGKEALERARAENKPIFLSIGYAACHWCHVMAHESFEDAATAALMNRHFINIKVDREERPDLDSIYMQATQAMTGSGGWPMSVFLTPDLRPFFAGTYFPPVPRHNLPSFPQVLAGVAGAWQSEQPEIERVGTQLLGQLRAEGGRAESSESAFSPAALEAATGTVLELYDWGNGGWGQAPKFPQPMTIEFLLRRYAGAAKQADQCLKAALHALSSMARGGMYDVVGGGFARYSTDAFWRVPHFEKMLYDNAQLALVYLHAFLITGQPAFRNVTGEVLDFVARELTSPEGGFYSSLDADSEGEEGRFYIWSQPEIEAALGEDPDLELFKAAYGVTQAGNWEGRTVLQRALDDGSLAARFKVSEDAVRARLLDCHRKLLARRALRPRPATDDKILTAWNGLMLQACAQAARSFPDSAQAARYRQMATRNADFLLTHLRSEQGLHRAFGAGRVSPEVFLEDYAALIQGLLELYQTDSENRWFEAARTLADEMIVRFSDGRGGFFDTPSGAERLLLRPKDLQDNATPSGNALACEALLLLAEFTGVARYRDLAEHALDALPTAAVRYPTAFARWLSAADRALAKSQQLAIVYGPSQAAEALSLLQVAWAGYRPNLVLAAARLPLAEGAPALLQDRPSQDGAATAYVCEHFVCKLPVTSGDALRGLL